MNGVQVTPPPPPRKKRKKKRGGETILYLLMFASFRDFMSIFIQGLPKRTLDLSTQCSKFIKYRPHNRNLSRHVLNLQHMWVSLPSDRMLNEGFCTSVVDISHWSCTGWRTLCKRHFQIHFLERRFFFRVWSPFHVFGRPSRSYRSWLQHKHTTS